MVISIFFLIMTNSGAFPKNQNESMIESTLEMMKYNISEIRKDLLPSDVLHLYFSQESALITKVQEQIVHLAWNITEMGNQRHQDQLQIQKLQRDTDVLRKELERLQRNSSPQRTQGMQTIATLAENEKKMPFNCKIYIMN